MSQPQSSRNTNIQIAAGTTTKDYEALISVTRPGISTTSETQYNYNQSVNLEHGGGTITYEDMTLVFAEREFDQLRRDLGAEDDEGYLKQDLNPYSFTITIRVEPESDYETSQKEITCEGCRITGYTADPIEKDSNYYKITATVSVQDVKEKILA